MADTHVSLTEVGPCRRQQVDVAHLLASPLRRLLVVNPLPRNLGCESNFVRLLAALFRLSVVSADPHTVLRCHQQVHLLGIDLVHGAVIVALKQPCSWLVFEFSGFRIKGGEYLRPSDFWPW